MNKLQETLLAKQNTMKEIEVVWRVIDRLKAKTDKTEQEQKDLEDLIEAKEYLFERLHTL